MKSEKILGYLQDVIHRHKPTSKITEKKVEVSGRRQKFKKIAIITAVVILVPLIILGIIGGLTYFPAKQIYASVQVAEVSAREMYDAVKQQDLVRAKEKLFETRSHLQTIDDNYRKLSWYRFTPVRSYYLDGNHAITAAHSGLNAGEKLLLAIEPYADVLGFTGEGTFAGGTAEERIVKIIETMDKVTPVLDEVAGDLQTIEHELAQIDHERYPFEVRGKSVSELITQAQEMSRTGVTAVTDIKPVLEVIPEVAGINDERKYLVLFQNDAELRPTGGFMTAYGILRVDKGRVHHEKSDDIYSLDQKFNSRLKPPRLISEYLPLVYYWYLRDMNLSPDFPTSMATFMEHYQTVRDEPQNIDGIVTVDTQVLSDLITILGPVDVPGFGTFTADIDPRCDCPQVIYELEDFATRPVAYIRTDRKSFLGPMMQTLLVKAYGAPKEVWPQLFRTVINNVNQKHVLFYMFDDHIQQAGNQVGITGQMKSFEGDYLHINDTNFGGAKSNLFITQEVEQVITPTENGMSKEVTITYKNPAPPSNCNLEAGQLCLNGTYRGVVRIYVPKGSTMQQNLGFSEGTFTTYEEFDKTVFEGFIEFQPQSQAKIILNYTVPYTPTDEYRLLIQKQPGTKLPKHTVIYNNTDKQELDLATDKEVVFEL